MKTIATSSYEQFQDIYPKYFLDKSKRINVKSITFVVTEDCTLRCSYCYECHKNKDNRMSFEVAKKCVDLMFEEDLKNTDIFGEESSTAVIIDFIGGEPLLEIKLIDRIVDYFLNKAVELNHRWQTEYMISIISNGTQFFTKDVQRFIKKYRERLSMSVSIDGNKELHDACRVFPDGSPSFDIAQKAFKECLKIGIANSTKMTIAPSNLPFLSDALKEMMMYENLTFLPANPVYEEEWTYDQATMYYEQLKDFANWNIENEIFLSKTTSLFENKRLGGALQKEDDQNWCGGTGLMMAFAPNGDIYPCIRYLPFSLQNKDEREKMIIGTSDEGLFKSADQLKRMKCLDCITRKSQSTDECFNCPISQGCGWCSGWNYDVYGTANKRFTGICNMHKARVLANVYYWNTIYKKYDIDERFPMNVPKEWALQIISNEEYEMLVGLSK